MTAPARPQRPPLAQVQEQPDKNPRSINRKAYLLGAAAVFGAAAGSADSAMDVDDLQSSGLDKVRKECAEAGLTDDQTDEAVASADTGFTKANYPPNAIEQVFACIRDRELRGFVITAPKMITRLKPNIYPRLCCATVMMGYTPCNAENSFPKFYFACNRVADAYNKVFGENIFPMVIKRFIDSVAVNRDLLRIDDPGSKGIKGKGRPAAYHIADDRMVMSCNLPDDMLLRDRWMRMAYEIQSAVK